MRKKGALFVKMFKSFVILQEYLSKSALDELFFSFIDSFQDVFIAHGFLYNEKHLHELCIDKEYFMHWMYENYIQGDQIF